jgi:outer membrane immunogenic protein
MRTLWLAAVAALTLSTGLVAEAADIGGLPYKGRPLPIASVTPAVNWTGCYVGAGGGYGMFNEETALVTRAPLGGIPVGTTFVNGLTQGGRGWLATAQAGCDYRLPFFGGDWVVGAFADADWTGMKGRHTGGNINIGLQDGNEKLRWDWSAGGRIGYLVRPQLLAYVSGGYTQASINAVNYLNAIFPAIGTPTGLELPSRKPHGWFIGVGAEYALGWMPNLFWKNEFRFANYGTRTDAVNCTTAALCGPVGPTAFSERNTLYVETFRTELVWKFNSGGIIASRY